MMRMKRRKTSTDETLRRYDPHGTTRMEQLAGRPLASFMSRGLAFGSDLIVILLFFVPTMYVLHWWRKGSGDLEHVDIHFDFHNVASLIFVELYFALSLYLSNGLTLGKRLLGIRVLSLERERITLWQATERSLGYGASMLEGGFGFLQYFIHPNRRCVHDRIADTIVIKERT